MHATANRVRRSLLPVVLILAFAVNTGGADARDTPTFAPTNASLARHAAPLWWRNAKFGIFVHWGVYSAPAFAPPNTPEATAPPRCSGLAEWYWFVQQLTPCTTWTHHLERFGSTFVYDDFIPRFTAKRFRPDAWIRLFRRAGARYFVLTAKHHDGFELWCSRTTRRSSCHFGPHRDLVGALFAAAHRARDAVRPGLYYSLPEWFNPAPRPRNFGPYGPDPFFSAKPPRNAYTNEPVPYTGYRAIRDYASDHIIPDIKALTRRYHPYELWCDIGGNPRYFRSNSWIADYYNQAKRTNPQGVVVNDRCGNSTTHRDYRTVEYSSDYPKGPFEVVRGMGSSFGYNAQEADRDYLSSPQLLRLLIDTVSRGGNLLLDIGPRADGSIPRVMVDRLKALGRWLEINGQAIYATRPWSRRPHGAPRFTVGTRHRFFIITESWPGRRLIVDGRVPVRQHSEIVLLGSNGKPLSYRRRRDGKLVIVMPAGGRRAAATRSRGAYVLRVAQTMQTGRTIDPEAPRRRSRRQTNRNSVIRSWARASRKSSSRR